MANGSVRIGKIFGIPIELHWLFILLMLIAFDSWKNEVNMHMHEVKQKFQPNPI